MFDDVQSERVEMFEKFLQGEAEDARRIEAEAAEYEKQWPNHCRTCGGWGEHRHSFDPSPDGVSLGAGSMEDAVPCPDCAEKGLCPRCMHIVEPDEIFCPSCGCDQERPEGKPTY
jgi:hypothetical protein